LLGLMVGEGHGEIEHEPQHRGLVVAQPFQEIVADALGRAAARAGAAQQRGLRFMVGEPAADNRILVLRF
jgi:hypothetical protein